MDDEPFPGGDPRQPHQRDISGEIARADRRCLGERQVGRFRPQRCRVDRDDLLTPESPEFWNVGLAADRIISPFGLSTRVVCTSFHGVTLDCWQADREGTPHKLVKLPYNFPSHAGETSPGGGPGTFVYADASAWSDS